MILPSPHRYSVAVDTSRGPGPSSMSSWADRLTCKEWKRSASLLTTMASNIVLSCQSASVSPVDLELGSLRPKRR